MISLILKDASTVFLFWFMDHLWEGYLKKKHSFYTLLLEHNGYSREYYSIGSSFANSILSTVSALYCLYSGAAIQTRVMYIYFVYDLFRLTQPFPSSMSLHHICALCLCSYNQIYKMSETTPLVNYLVLTESSTIFMNIVIFIRGVSALPRHPLTPNELVYSKYAYVCFTIVFFVCRLVLLPYAVFLQFRDPGSFGYAIAPITTLVCIQFYWFGKIVRILVNKY